MTKMVVFRRIVYDEIEPKIAFDPRGVAVVELARGTRIHLPNGLSVDLAHDFEHVVDTIGEALK